MLNSFQPALQFDLQHNDTLKCADELTDSVSSNTNFSRKHGNKGTSYVKTGILFSYLNVAACDQIFLANQQLALPQFPQGLLVEGNAPQLLLFLSPS